MPGFTETRTVYASGVMGVPAHIVGNTLADITSIKKYGMNKVISCCILEKGVPPTEAGSIRRCTLCMKRFHDAMLREKLVSIEQDEERRTVAVLEYVPCEGVELHRSPFGKTGTETLLGALTTYTVSQVSTCENKCYVEVSTELQLTRKSEFDFEKGERELLYSIQLFWQNYVDGLLMSLESFVLSQAYPVLSGRIDTQFREAYEEQEEVFVQWASSTAENFPRQLVLDNFEKMLVHWSRVLQEYRHQKLIAETIKADVEGANLVSAETAKQLAESNAMVERLRKEQEEAEAQNPFNMYKPSYKGEEKPPAPNPRLDGAHHRRLYQTASTTDPKSAASTGAHGATGSGGNDGPSSRQGRTSPSSAVYGSDPQRLVKLSTAECTRGKLSELLQWDTKATKPNTAAKGEGIETPKLRALPKSYDRSMLNNLFTAGGALDEEEAKAIFQVLDVNQTESLSANEVVAILMSMDHTGLYEDVDGTHDQVELYRRRIQESYAQRVSAPQPVPGSAAGAAAAEEPKTFAPADTESALGKMVARHEAEAAARREKAMMKLAEDTVNRFAFRESGKLYFDEFCLSLLHLLRA